MQSAVSRIRRSLSKALLARATERTTTASASPRSAIRRIEPLEARQLLAAVSWDGGGDGVSWTSANNWSTNTLPTSADDVTINIAANPIIKLNGANAVIHSLNSAESLNLDSGTLNVAAASSITAASSLTGATITGTGDLTISGLTWVNGTMNGSGKTILAGSTTSDVNSGSQYLSRTLEVDGTLNMNDAAGYIFRFGAGGGTDSGTLDVANGGTVKVTDSGAISVYSGSAHQILVHTGGTFTKSAGSGTTTVNVPVNTAGGVVSATVGTLSLTGSSTPGAGTFTATSPAVLQFPSGSFSFDGTLLQNVTLNGGRFDGAGTVTVTGLNWASGYMQGTGKTIVGAGAASTIASGGTHYLARTLEVDGTINMSAVSGYPFYFGAGSGTDVGTVDIVNGGTFAFTADGTAGLYSGTAANDQFLVRTGGTLTKSDGAGTSTVAIPVNTAGGVVSATSGTLSLTGGTNAGLGAYLATSPGNLQFTTGTFQFDGTLLQNTTLNGGRFDGAGNVTVTGLNWISGYMQGTGKTIVGIGTPSQINSGGTHYLSRTLEVDGTLNLTNASGYPLYFGAGSGTDAGTIDIVSGGTMDFTSNGAIGIYSGLAANDQIVVRSGGTFTKSSGVNTPTVAIPVNNVGGTVSASSGILSLTGGGASAGGTFISSGTGVVQLTNGTFTFDGTSLQNVTLAGATIDGPGTVNVTGLNWASGMMKGAGKTIFGSGTPSTITNGGTHYVARTLEIDGTVNVTAPSGYPIYYGVGSGADAGTIDIVSGGTLNFTGDDNIGVYSGIAANDQLIVRAGGTLIKSGGTSTTQISVPFTNFGTVRAQVKTLSFTSTTNIGTGTFLSGGTYVVSDGATLLFNGAIATLTADLQIDGTGSVPQLTGLTLNRGRIGLTNGADVTLPATNPARVYTQEGILDLSPDSVFTVNGSVKFAGVSQPVVRAEIASATSFGKLVITGTLDLNSPDSTSRFDPDLVGGYDPALGTNHNVIVANGGITNAFDSFQGGLTPSGNVLLLKSVGTTTLAVSVGPGPLPPAPKILSESFDYVSRQALIFQFDQDVSAFLGRKDYQILNLTTGQSIPQSAGTLAYNQTSNQATLTLTNQLPDGNYRITVNAGDIANSAGVPASGAPVTLDFYVLAGDADHNRTVDFNDLLILAANYGSTGKTFSQGDFDYTANGSVDFNDLLILAKNYNKTLPAAAALLAVSTDATPTVRRHVADDIL